MLTLDAIKTAKDYREQELDIPEWSGSIKIRTLSMGARYDIAEFSLVQKGKERVVDNKLFAIATLCHGVVDPKINEQQAAEIIEQRSPESIQRILDGIWKISDLTESEIKNGLPPA